MKRQLKAGAGASLLLAAAASVALVGGADTASSAGVPSSAYGIAGEGLIPIPPTPEAISTDGSLVEEEAIGVPVEGLADLGLITATAENDHATASVAQIDVTGALLGSLGLDAALAPINDACDQLAAAAGNLTAELGGALEDLVGQLGAVTDPITNGDLLANPELLDPLQDLCDTLEDLGQLIHIGAVEAECTGHTGTTKIGNIDLLGLPVVLPTGANQALSDGQLGALAPLVDLKLNTQTENADGTFTVTALELTLLDQITLSVASATCGHVSDATTNAPSPTPVETKHPVTG